jgi:hypothetical protein
MLRVLTEDQEKFASYAWMLARHRAALAKQLAEVDGYLREAVRLAEQHGVRQKTLAVLTNFTPARISQIVNDDTPNTDTTMLETVTLWRAAIEEPQAHLARLSKKSTRENLEEWEEKYRLIYNKDSGAL